jgi:hypothetical protein
VSIDSDSTQSKVCKDTMPVYCQALMIDRASCRARLPQSKIETSSDQKHSEAFGNVRMDMGFALCAMAG